jgi:transcriptional regulator with XRE-family HTH domain
MNPMEPARVPNLMLRDLRAKKRLTQPELARKAKVSLGTVSGVESGRIPNPSVLTKEKLAQALGVAREVIFPEEAFERVAFA